jgi:hypothetical protein
MTNDARATRPPGGRLIWSGEAPIASLVAVPGTPCRCTVSRRALERMAGVRRLGPSACLDMVDRFREVIEAIAVHKYLREGAGPERCIHVTSADVATAGVLVPASAMPPAAVHLTEAEADAQAASIAAGIAA